MAPTAPARESGSPGMAGHTERGPAAQRDATHIKRRDTATPAMP